MKRLALSILLVLLCLLVSGCPLFGKGWTHPNIAGPRDEDKIFVEHKVMCEDQAAKTSAKGAEADKAFEACMRAKGWEKAE